MLPLVSILIPARNAERWIADAIQSALDQTWKRKEIIVVDDGSTDQTIAIASQYVSKGVSIVSQKTQGASAARNHAFSICNGDFIQWLDADDILARDKIARQLSILGNSTSRRILISSEWARFTFRPKKARFIASSLWCDLSPEEWLIRKLEQNLFMQTATWLVSRELSLAAGEWDVRMLSDDDGEYFCRIIRASEYIRFCEGARVYYRDTPSTRLSQIGMSDTKKEAMVLSIKLHIHYLRSLSENARIKTACLIYIQNWLGYCYPERPDLVQELQKLAVEVGGGLVPPRLRKKYNWIVPFLGWPVAKRLQTTFPLFRRSLKFRFDKFASVVDRLTQVTP